MFHQVVVVVSPPEDLEKVAVLLDRTFPGTSEQAVDAAERYLVLEAILEGLPPLVVEFFAREVNEDGVPVR